MTESQLAGDGVPSASVGGIVLCGGKSSRMGRPKLALPFGDELLLPRVIRILRTVVSPVIVVAAPGQELPPLPAGVEVVCDELEGQGPLAGLAVGLEALMGRVPAAYVSACDVPLLRPEFIRAVIGRLRDLELAVPRDGEFFHPLAAVYRTSLASRVRDLLRAGRRRPRDLIDSSRTAIIAVDDLRTADPALDSLRNLNTPEEYQTVLLRAGY